MSRRVDILDSLVEACEAIKEGVTVKDFLNNDYTYQTTPQLVSKDFEIWTGVHRFPAIFVNSGDTTLEGFPSRRYRAIWEIVLTLYVKNNASIEDELSAVIEDVLVAVSQDIVRGGCATATFATRIDTETRLQKGYGLAEVALNIHYHFGV